MITCRAAAGKGPPRPAHPLLRSVLDPRILALRDRLAAYRPVRWDGTDGGARASVALVVRPAPTDLDLLLIRRAEAPGDPWSGHMALPGGRRSPADADARATAARETREEVGVDLAAAGVPLGSLDDVAPLSRAPRIVVSPFVFAVPPGTTTTPNHEVALAVWVPLQRLAAPGAATEYLHALASGEQLRFPAIGFEEHVIWGLTHRILTHFFAVAGLHQEQGEAE